MRSMFKAVENCRRISFFFFGNITRRQAISTYLHESLINVYKYIFFLEIPDISTIYAHIFVMVMNICMDLNIMKGAHD